MAAADRPGGVVRTFARWLDSENRFERDGFEPTCGGECLAALERRDEPDGRLPGRDDTCMHHA